VLITTLVATFPTHSASTVNEGYPDVLTEEKLDDIRDQLEHSPHKLLKHKK
jgi:hypothetical protein